MFDPHEPQLLGNWCVTGLILAYAGTTFAGIAVATYLVGATVFALVADWDTERSCGMPPLLRTWLLLFALAFVCPRDAVVFALFSLPLKVADGFVTILAIVRALPLTVAVPLGASPETLLRACDMRSRRTLWLNLYRTVAALLLPVAFAAVGLHLLAHAPRAVAVSMLGACVRWFATSIIVTSSTLAAGVCAYLVYVCQGGQLRLQLQVGI